MRYDETTGYPIIEDVESLHISQAEKEIEMAQDLVEMETTKGWKILKQYMESQIDGMIHQMKRLDNMEDVRRSQEFIKAYGPDSLGAKIWEHYIWALKGETAKAQEWIEQKEKQMDFENTSYYSIEIACLWVELDKPDKVFFYLNNARENHDPYMFNVQMSPFFDDYRSDPRYGQLLRKMGLEK